jgi:hypothetical protein
VVVGVVMKRRDCQIITPNPHFITTTTSEPPPHNFWASSEPPPLGLPITGLTGIAYATREGYLQGVAILVGLDDFLAAVGLRACRLAIGQESLF